jgi:hypothetical protein
MCALRHEHILLLPLGVNVGGSVACRFYCLEAKPKDSSLVSFITL